MNKPHKKDEISVFLYLDEYYLLHLFSYNQIVFLICREHQNYGGLNVKKNIVFVQNLISKKGSHITYIYLLLLEKECKFHPNHVIVQNCQLQVNIQIYFILFYSKLLSLNFHSNIYIQKAILSVKISLINMALDSYIILNRFQNFKPF